MADDDENEVDNTEDWIDERLSMSEEELNELEDAVRVLTSPFFVDKGDTQHYIIEIYQQRFTDSKNCIRYQELQYHHPPTMVPHS